MMLSFLTMGSLGSGPVSASVVDEGAEESFGMRKALVGFGLSVALAVGLLVTVAAGAAAAAPALRVFVSTPDYVTPGKLMDTWVSVMGTGSDPLSGNLTVRYTFPSGVVPADPQDDSFHVSPVCNTVGQVTECTADVTGIEAGMQIRFKTITSVALGAPGGPGLI